MPITVNIRTLVTLLWTLSNFQNAALLGIEIVDIQANCDRNFVSFNSTIHTNRTMFDINFSVHRLLRSHDLFMNIKLKTKFGNASSYQMLHQWRRVSVCKYLGHFFDHDDSLFKYFFKQNPEAASNIRCPLKKGDYYMRNFQLQQKSLMGILQEGSYRVFVEIAHVSGEVVKLFALQITAKYYDKESNDMGNEV